MFTRVMWATDGSGRADHALAYAVALAEREHAQLHVAHVVEKLAGGQAAGVCLAPAEDEAQAKIREQIALIAADRPVHTTLHLVDGAWGQVGTRLAELATKTGVDVIVMGTRGHGPIGSLILGSVTRDVLHRATCPVLVVPRTANSPHDFEPSTLVAAG